MSDVLVVEGVRKWFRSGHERITPVDGVDLRLASSEVLVLTGPSGSGKTTLLQMIAGFQRPDEGMVTWPDSAATPAWSEVAVIPQSLGLLPELTVAENVALPLLAASVSVDVAAPQVAAVLAELRVDQLADRLVGEVSLGQQQRVAVARALVIRPVVVLADEPTSHQDGEHAHVVLAALRGAARRGTGCLIAGHDPRLLEVADRVVHLEDGRLAGGTGD